MMKPATLEEIDLAFAHLYDFPARAIRSVPRLPKPSRI